MVKLAATTFFGCDDKWYTVIQHALVSKYHSKKNRISDIHDSIQFENEFKSSHTITLSFKFEEFDSHKSDKGSLKIIFLFGKIKVNKAAPNIIKSNMLPLIESTKITI